MPQRRYKPLMFHPSPGFSTAQIGIELVLEYRLSVILRTERPVKDDDAPSAFEYFECYLLDAGFGYASA